MAESATRRRLGVPIALGALGLALVVGGLITWSWAADAERVTDLVRDELTERGLERHREDLEAATALFDGFVADVLPAVAGDLGVPADQLVAQIRADSPELDRFLAEQPAIFALADNSLENLEAQQQRFRAADRPPTSGLPITAGPAAAVVLGFVVLGGAALAAWGRRPGLRTAGLVAALVAGVVVAAGTVASGAPGKAADASEVMDSLDPSAAAVEATEAAFATVSDAVDALTDDVLPALADRLGESTLGLSLRLAAQYPDVALGVTAIPGIVNRYEDRLEIRVEAAPELRRLADVPLTALVWGAVVLGVAIAATAAAGLAGARRTRAASPAALTPAVDPGSPG